MPIKIIKKTDMSALFALLDLASEELMKFKAEKRSVLSQLNELEEALEVARNNVKNALKLEYQGKPSGQYKPYSGGFCRVEVASKWKRSVDIEKLLQHYPDAATEKVIRVEVDLKELDARVEEGKFDKEIVD